MVRYFVTYAAFTIKWNTFSVCIRLHAWPDLLLELETCQGVGTWLGCCGIRQAPQISPLDEVLDDSQAEFCLVIPVKAYAIKLNSGRIVTRLDQ